MLRSLDGDDGCCGDEQGEEDQALHGAHPTGHRRLLRLTEG